MQHELFSGAKKKFWKKMKAKTTSAFRDVYDVAVSKNLYMRGTAYVIAINQVAEEVKSEVGSKFTNKRNALFS